MIAIYAKYVKPIDNQVNIEKIDILDYPDCLRNSEGDFAFVIDSNATKFSISGLTEEFVYKDINNVFKTVNSNIECYLSSTTVDLQQLTFEEIQNIAVGEPGNTIIDLYNILDAGTHLLHSCGAYTSAIEEPTDPVDKNCRPCMIKWGFDNPDTCDFAISNNNIPVTAVAFEPVFSQYYNNSGTVSCTTVNEDGEIIGYRETDIILSNYIYSPAQAADVLNTAIGLVTNLYGYYPASDGGQGFVSFNILENNEVLEKQLNPEYFIIRSNDFDLRATYSVDYIRQDGSAATSTEVEYLKFYTNREFGTLEDFNFNYFSLNLTAVPEILNSKRILKINLPGFSINNNTQPITNQNSGSTPFILSRTNQEIVYGATTNIQHDGSVSICLDTVSPQVPYYITVRCGNYYASELLGVNPNESEWDQRQRMLETAAISIYDAAEAARRADPGFDPMNDTTKITRFIFDRGDGSNSASFKTYGINYAGGAFENYPGTSTPNPYSGAWTPGLIPTGWYSSGWSIPGWDGSITPYFTRAWRNVGVPILDESTGELVSGEDFTINAIETLATLFIQLNRIPDIASTLFFNGGPCGNITKTTDQVAMGASDTEIVAVYLEPRCYVYVSRGAVPPPMLPWLLPEFDKGGTNTSTAPWRCH